MGGATRLFPCKETRDRYHFLSPGNEQRSPEPSPELLVHRIKVAFAFNLGLAILVIVHEATAPITEVGEAFVFKGDPVSLTIF